MPTKICVRVLLATAYLLFYGHLPVSDRHSAVRFWNVKYSMPKVYQKRLLAVTIYMRVSLFVVQCPLQFVCVFSGPLPIVCSTDICLWTIGTQLWGFENEKRIVFLEPKLASLSKANVFGYREVRRTKDNHSRAFENVENGGFHASNLLNHVTKSPTEGKKTLQNFKLRV